MSILPQLEQDLGNAADRRLPTDLAASAERPRRRPRRRIAAGGVPIVLSVLVAVVIAVIAIAAFSHGHGSTQPAGPNSSASPRSALINAIAALREPQIPADRDPRFLRIAYETTRPAAYLRSHPQARKFLAEEGYPAPDRPLLRVITVPSLHAHVLIAPTTYQPSARSSRRSEGINLAYQGPGNSEGSTGPRPRTVGSFLAHGLALVLGVPHHDRNLGVLLVPDGVARVSFGSARPLPFQTPYRVNPTAIAKAMATVHATATVHHNLAAYSLAIPTIVNQNTFVTKTAIAARTQTTWYAADGTIIRRTTTQIYVFLNIQRHA